MFCNSHTTTNSDPFENLTISADVPVTQDLVFNIGDPTHRLNTVYANIQAQTISDQAIQINSASFPYTGTPDARLLRSAAKTLTIDDGSGGPATLDVSSISTSNVASTSAEINNFEYNGTNPYSTFSDGSSNGVMVIQPLQGANEGYSSLNWNQYFTTDYQRFNTAKNGYSLTSDQRGTSDQFDLTTFTGSGTNILMLYDAVNLPNVLQFPIDVTANTLTTTGTITAPTISTTSGDLVLAPAGSNVNFNAKNLTSVGTVACSDTTLTQSANGMFLVTNGLGNAPNSSNVAIQSSPPGVMTLNFNGYFNGTEQRFNTSKRRYRFWVDQRSITDNYMLDSFDGTTRTVHMTLNPSAGMYILFDQGISTSSITSPTSGISLNSKDLTSANSLSVNPLSANPGGSNTFWSNSGVPMFGSNALATAVNTPNYQTVNTSGSWSGPWSTSQAGNFTFSLVGNVVTVWIQGVSATGASAAIATIAEIPAAYQTTKGADFSIGVISSGAYSPGTCRINPSSNIISVGQFGLTNFTVGASCGWNSFQISYTI